MHASFAAAAAPSILRRSDNSTHDADTIFSSSAASSAPHSPLRIEHVDVALVAVTAQLGAIACPALLRASPIFSSCHDAPLHRWWSSPLKGCPPSLPSGRLGHNAIVLTHITRLPKAAVFVSGRLGLRGFHPCLDLPDNRQSAALPTCTSSRSFASSDSTTPPGISYYDPPRICPLHLSEFGPSRLSYFRVFGARAYIYILGFWVKHIYNL